MEKSFDFGILLQNYEKKHKSRPSQFSSVLNGIRKRLEDNLKRRKSSRLTVFDNIRNLQTCCDTPKKADPLTKLEHRKMQLEKWKEEKEKKKKLAAAQKKKPFVTGIPRAPLKYEPPPPPKVVPSTSGRVTRSQTAKAQVKPKASNLKPASQAKTQSFAPKNASFKPPNIKDMTVLPILAPPTKKKRDVKAFEFKPLKPEASGNKATKPKTQPKSAEKGVSQKQVGSKKLTQSKFEAPSSSGQSHSSEELETPTKLKPSNSKTSTGKSKGAKTRHQNDNPVQNSDTQKSTRTSRTKYLTPNKAIPKSESSSEERLRSPKSPVDVPMTPEQIAEEVKRISPCVTLSRGKDNARREIKKKLEEGLLDEDNSNTESVVHFRRQLNSEIKRITEMCDTWDKISEQTVLPEPVQEAVLGAVGQARLLMSKKLQQFAGLVDRCERPDPLHALVTPADLHGFWDMVFMQIVNVDMRFKKLEEMRARNWVEEVPVAVNRKAKVPVKAAVRPAATSRLKDIIAAARKAKKQVAGTVESPSTASQPAEVSKTFEAGFFRVQSPVRQPAPAAPAAPSTPLHRSSLLKSVLSSETKKSAYKSSASLAMLRASLIGKNVDNEVLAEPLVPLTPLNQTATPGRSILKPLNTSTRKSSKKSIKMVLFEKSDAENDISITEGVSELTVEDDLKEAKKRLTRQNAVEDRSPVMTRSRRKSMSTPVAEEKPSRRSSLRKKQEVE